MIDVLFFPHRPPPPYPSLQFGCSPSGLTYMRVYVCERAAVHVNLPLFLFDCRGYLPALLKVETRCVFVCVCMTFLQWAELVCLPSGLITQNPHRIY